MTEKDPVRFETKDDRFLDCLLTESERRSRSDEAHENLHRAGEKQQEKEAHKAKAAAAGKEADLHLLRAHKLSEAARTGKESRQVLVHFDYMPTHGEVWEVREDTGEVLDRRKPYAAEWDAIKEAQQPDLPAVPKVPAQGPTPDSPAGYVRESSVLSDIAATTAARLDRWKADAQALGRAHRAKVPEGWTSGVLFSVIGLGAQIDAREEDKKAVEAAYAAGLAEPMGDLTASVAQAAKDWDSLPGDWKDKAQEMGEQHKAAGSDALVAPQNVASAIGLNGLDDGTLEILFDCYSVAYAQAKAPKKRGRPAKVVP